jgi:predicted acetylornithine/succinylornithine family transaminase
MNKDEVIALYDQYVMNTYNRGLVLTHGRGTKVWDADGKVYLDFAGGIAVLPVGHANPVVAHAIAEQAAKGLHFSNLYYNQNQAVLAKKIAEISMGGKCFFCNSGAEANEGLVKLARQWGHDSGRYEVICMKQSFHGRTLAMIAATGQDKVKKGFEPLPEGFVHAEFNNLDSVKALVGPKTVAVLVEAVQGEGGVIPATDEFMKGLRALCDEKNLLLLCDEVQCGLGRTGNWFGFQAYGITPDAFSLAKGLGSGCPIGAVVAAPKVADVLKPGQHASTFGGGPLACAAALATLQVIESDGLVQKAEEIGQLFRDGLSMFVENYEHVKEVRGRGLMVGLVLDEPAKPLCDALTAMGLIAIPTAEKVVRFLPPLNVKESELEEALEIIEDALNEVYGGGEGEEEEEGA